MITRPKILLLSFYLAFSLILARLFYLQVIFENSNKVRINQQNYKLNILAPNRGTVFSNDLQILAHNDDIYLLSIYKPNLKNDIWQVISDINKVKPNFTIDNQKSIDKFISNQNQKWITFPTTFNFNETGQLNFPGIEIKHQFRRLYPQDGIARQLVGTSIIKENGQILGLGGIESYYQKQLSGKTGFIYSYKDALGNTIFPKKTWGFDKVDGLDVYTSINSKIQFLIETKLKTGIEKFKADSGSISIIESKTGRILAMTSMEATNSTDISPINPAIFEIFEPGSIFKPLIVAMALNQKIIDLNFICQECNRPYIIGNDTITNWNSETHPNSSLKDIIKNSDNIGMTSIIRKLGLKNFLLFYEKLELYKKTGIDLQGESRPLKKDYWPEIDLATASFGQGIALSQIKMLQVFNTLANNGILLQPSVVDYYTDETKKFYPKKYTSQKIFEDSAVNQVNEILKYSVENGVVAKLKPNNIEVCAKSGTAQIAIKGKYTDSSSIASYIGFSPCKNPQYTMIVTIKNPRSSPWGSSTAAPIWYEIAANIPNLL